MKEAILRLRFASAQAYFELWHEAATNGWDAGQWRRALAEHESSDHHDSPVNRAKAMLLAEPRWVKHIYAEPVEELCGTRAFARDPNAECQSRRLWGYSCTFPQEEREVDHLFPRWLGGPTEPGNRLDLCSTHNKAKAGDVHLFPWEEELPEWLAPRIRKIGAALSVKRT